MDYMQASKRFDLDKFINNVKDLDYSEIIKSLNKEIGLAANFQIPNKSISKSDIEYIQVKYIANLKGLSFLIEHRIKPAGVDNDTLVKFRPILLSLISKQQINDGVLKVIE